MAEYSKGKIIKGTVTGVESYGAFVSLDEYYTGLIHISEISHNYVKNIHDFINIGDDIYVQIIGVDDKNYHLNLSIKNINYKKKDFKKKKQIIETPLGFTTLKAKLPIWIEESLKKYEKTIK